MDLIKLFDGQKEFFLSDITLQKNFRIIQLIRLKKSLLNNENSIYKSLYEDLKNNNYSYEFQKSIKLINYFIRRMNYLSKVKKIKVFLMKSKGYVYKKPFGVCLIINICDSPIYSLIKSIACSIISGNTSIILLDPRYKNLNNIIENLLKETFESYYITPICYTKEALMFLCKLNFDFLYVKGDLSITNFVLNSFPHKNIKIDITGSTYSLIHSDADINPTTNYIIKNKLQNINTTPHTIYVHSKIKDDFLKAFKENLKNICISLYKFYIDKINLIEEVLDNTKDNYHKTLVKVHLNIDSRKDLIYINFYDILDTLIYDMKDLKEIYTLNLFTNNKYIINKYVDIPFEYGFINPILNKGNNSLSKIDKYKINLLLKSFLYEKVIDINKYKEDSN